MKFTLDWKVGVADSWTTPPETLIPATVPGAVQLDWARHHEWPPYWQGENFRAYVELEDRFWRYETRLQMPDLPSGARLFFVCGGVDYKFSITLAGRLLHEQEGMFTPVEIELTHFGKNGDALCLIVHPAPKSVVERTRAQADRSCKPAVSYGWDFHPRLIPLGIWQETFLEIRAASFFAEAQVDYTLSDDLQTAELRLTTQVNGQAEKCAVRWSVFAPDGSTVFVTQDSQYEIDALELWWPHDQGAPALYTSIVELLDPSGTVLDRREQRIGFRRVRLIMAPDQWREPSSFPKSRSHPPMTLEINGRAIFAKGANWVSPEIFPGLLNRQTYVQQLNLAKQANMNLLRMWGGAPLQKESFYTLCDELGLMVWQEFPLACNAYPDDSAYLRVLDQESRSIIYQLKPHPSVVLWCGGNELFNTWSRMTDQSLAVRLLASNCFQLDPARPFLPTSPLDGVGHGYYAFRHHQTGEETWSIFQNARNTAYCEFGVPGPAPAAVLREMIPDAELFPPNVGGTWEAHHAFKAWEKSSWLDVDTIEDYFGVASSLELLVERGQLLQAEGYRGIYEEARRQKPVASMALCWCLNEPWPTAANNSLLSWPSHPKPALIAVGEACRPILASARIRKFQWTAGELFDPELFWLNDAPQPCEPGEMEAQIELSDGRVFPLLSWNAGPLAANTNLPGPKIRWTLPDFAIGRFTLVLRTPGRPEAESRYLLIIRSRKAAGAAVMNLG